MVFVVILHGRKTGKEIHLAIEFVGLRGLATLHRFFECDGHLCAMAAEPVECAGLDKRFADLLINCPQIDIFAEMEKALKAADLFSCRDDLLDRLCADTL